MSEQRHVFEPGETRYIWLDENGERTSMYHKSIPAAYNYRNMLVRHSRGEKVYSRTRGEYFRPQGTGKAAVRLVKVVMIVQQQDMNDEERADVAAAERVMSGVMQ
jgi:hypothetical protein